MKKKNLLFFLLILPFFLDAQSYEVLPKSGISVYSNFRMQFLDFSDLNSQLESYNIKAMDSHAGGFTLGLQYNFANSKIATAAEVSVVEACPDQHSEATTMSQLTGFGGKIKQSYTLFSKNNWSIIPSIGVGYQRLCMHVNGEVISAGSARITTPFKEKVCSSNVYTDLTLGFEKEIPLSRRSLYLGGNVGYRKTLDGTTSTQTGEEGYIDWSATNSGGGMVEFSFRMDLF